MPIASQGENSPEPPDITMVEVIDADANGVVDAEAGKVACQDDLEDPIKLNRWEEFVVARPCCSCWSFFGISIFLAFITTRMLGSGALAFSVQSVWDVRDHEIVKQRDAFMGALIASGQELMCSAGGGPPRPCEEEDVPRNYTERSQKMDQLTIIYEAVGDNDNLLSAKTLALMRKLENDLMNMDIFKKNCQVVGKKMVSNIGGKTVDSYAASGQCGATQSILNDVYINNALHEDLMTSKCFTSQPVCNTGAATPFCVAANVSGPTRCIKCGAGVGETPYGTPPCRSSALAPLAAAPYGTGLATICEGSTTAGATAMSADPAKTKAYFKSQMKLLPRDFACAGKVPGKAKYARAFMAFGGPTKGNTAFHGDAKEEQVKDFSDMFVKDMWPDIQKAKKEIEDSSDGTLRVYAMSAAAIQSLFLKIAMQDGLLAVGSIMFVFMWIWTATGSAFLAACGIYECFISLFLAMMTFAPVSKYINFLSVMMIFVIIGIGADDIFVFLDAFKQSAYEPQLRGELRFRFAWAWRRSASAMFVTTATTCVSFVAAAWSDIPTISAFGWFAAMTVAWDYLLVITFFASATVIYHKYFEGKKGGHMCIDLKCCCFRLFVPSPEKKAELGWKAYKRLIVLVSVLGVLGIFVCLLGSSAKMAFLPMIGAIILCVAAICAQAVLNMPEDPTKMRTLERFFSTTFHGALDKHKKKIVVTWIVFVLVCAILVGAVLRPAEESPKFLSEENDIMKFIDLAAEFQSDTRVQILHTVYGIQKADSIDRDGVDYQTPAGEYLGKIGYSASAKNVAATKAGQTVMIDYCDKLRASDIVIKDESCQIAFHAKTNPTFMLPTLGSEVGHCKTGVYCFMYFVRDFLTAHCKPCARVGGQVPAGSMGCNPSDNFVACRDSAGAAITGGAAAFPANDLHKVMQSPNYTAYVDSLMAHRYRAGHGHDNSKVNAMTGTKYIKGGAWVGFVGANFSMPRRSNYQVKKKWFDRAKAFVEANTIGMPDAFGSCQRFNWMITEKTLVTNTIQAFVIATGFAWIMLILTGWNWILGTLGFLSVVTICTIACAVMVVLGWELGIIESIAIITVVGVSVDYSVHLLHAYGECSADTPTERARGSLKTMGISLVGGVATTVGASLFLWFAEIQFFTKFGQFLGITVIVSIVVALTFLMPLLMIIGPVGEGGRLPACRKRNEVVAK